MADVERIARWITKMAGVFGLDANAQPPYDRLGWASVISADVDPATAVQPYVDALTNVKKDVRALSISSEALAALLEQDPTPEFEAITKSGSRDIEQPSSPYLRVVSKIRDELRRIVSAQEPQTKKVILKLTDRIRDEDLTNLGVYLDGRPNNQQSGRRRW